MKNKGLYQIGEAADLVGVSVETLRSWEERSDVPLGRVKRDYKGHRVYTRQQIKSLQKFRNTLR